MIFKTLLPAGLILLNSLTGFTFDEMPAPKRNPAVDDYFLTPPPPDKRGLSGFNGQLLLNGKPYRGVGVNYVAAFSNINNNPEDTATGETFRILAEQNIPFVRSPIMGWGTDAFKLYLDDKAEYFRRMDKVVALAEKYHIGIICSFFWSGWMSALTGETNLDAWVDSKSETHRRMGEYIEEVVTRYRSSPAIWGWEWGNECGLSCHLPNAAEFGITEKSQMTFATMRKVYAEFANQIRRHDPHRIISSGDGFPRPQAFNNMKNANWEKDTPGELYSLLVKNAPDPMNVLSLHAYGDDFERDRLPVGMRAAGSIKKPAFVGEFGVAGPHTGASEKEFRKQLAMLDQVKVPLAALWEFDLTSVNHPRAEWVIAPGSDKFYMLEAVGAINRAWAAERK